MKAIEIIREIESFAPLSTQESYDNCGIQVGDSHTEVNGRRPSGITLVDA